ncbi:MAG: hypothetical protein EXQ86_07740 [Rhodospirillales bacterium]|nr:hypothetical protein [Rhodospirillales bacterium]
MTAKCTALSTAFPLIAALALGGCWAWGEPVSTFWMKGCVENPEQQLADVDFSTARQVNIAIRHGDFSPMIVKLTQNRPYLLRIRNRDEWAHVFNAPDFFRSVAIAAVAVDNELVEERCFRAIALKPGQTAEIQLLALKDGRFVFEDTRHVVPLVPPRGNGGVIMVEEAI